MVLAALDPADEGAALLDHLSDAPAVQTGADRLTTTHPSRPSRSPTRSSSSRPAEADAPCSPEPTDCPTPPPSPSRAEKRTYPAPPTSRKPTEPRRRRS